jgi:hypothetical protein
MCKRSVAIAFAVSAATFLLVTRLFGETPHTTAAVESFDSKWIMDLLVMAATIAIAYFARSTDQAYHRIADVASKLTTIVEQQAEIIRARDEPIIIARIESVFDANGKTVTSEYLRVRNIGAPITEISIETAQLFEIRYSSTQPPGNVETAFMGTVGYYPASSSPSPEGDYIFTTVKTRYRDLIFDIHRTTDRTVGSCGMLVTFRQFFRIDYRTRTNIRKTRWFSADAFGSKEIQEVEGCSVFQTINESMRLSKAFVFYNMGIDEFCTMASQCAPPQTFVP